MMSPQYLCTDNLSLNACTDSKGNNHRKMWELPLNSQFLLWTENTKLSEKMNFQGVSLSTKASGRKVKTDNMSSQSYTENSQKQWENRGIKKEKRFQKTGASQMHSKLKTAKLANERSALGKEPGRKRRYLWLKTSRVTEYWRSGKNPERKVRCRE